MLSEENLGYNVETFNEDDLVLIGSGGFAKVYKDKSNGLVLKKLKEDFIVDEGICSRFKREFTITKSLGDLDGIIDVFDYFDDIYAYTMEEAEQTFYNHIIGKNLSESNKKTYIKQILNIMKSVHQRDIIHRDLSPNNILIIDGVLKISDFGLGKDLNMFNLYQTIYTNSLGQYSYCAPEQFMMLKDGDKRSDVYSLGRIINFILTKDPNNNHHFLRAVSEKATSHNAVFRFADASELLKSVERSIEFHENALNKQELIEKARKGLLDEDIENFIYEMSGDELCNEIIASNGFRGSILKFMKTNEERAIYILGVIEDNFRDVCLTWESYNPFAEILYDIIVDDFPFPIKELAAIILNYIAYDINRFSAQRLIENLKDRGIEPLIEEIFS
jgi:serine/threonine protein kinase